MEHHHAINGKIHYVNGHFPLLFVGSPEGTHYDKVEILLHDTLPAPALTHRGRIGVWGSSTGTGPESVP